jgi:hypothetical protein
MRGAFILLRPSYYLKTGIKVYYTRTAKSSAGEFIRRRMGGVPLLIETAA